MTDSESNAGDGLIEAAKVEAAAPSPPPPPKFPPLQVGKERIGFEHLNDFEFTFDTEARQGVRCTVHFSTHCFSDKYDPERHAHRVKVVDEANQARYFDQDRYDLSKGLKERIESLPSLKVFQSPQLNYAIITTEAGREYRVYFNVRKSSGKNVMRLYVESAYAPDAETFNVAPKSAHQPVRFKALVDKLLAGKALKFNGR